MYSSYKCIIFVIIMATKRVILDKDFDKVVIRTNKRARNITMRTKPDGLYVTTPPYTFTKRVIEVVDEYRESLLEHWDKVKIKPILPGYVIDAPCFKLSIVRGAYTFFSVKHTDDSTVIMCPGNLDYSAHESQKMLRLTIVRAMKKRAEVYLPPLLNELSNLYSLPFNKVKISSSRGRWGSCSGNKSINLSCYLMLLPVHLMDYVMLHELSHTKEMNHGPDFWRLLDTLTLDKAKSLRAELRNYSLAVFSL